MDPANAKPRSIGYLPVVTAPGFLKPRTCFHLFTDQTDYEYATAWRKFGNRTLGNVVQVYQHQITTLEIDYLLTHCDGLRR